MTGEAPPGPGAPAAAADLAHALVEVTRPHVTAVLLVGSRLAGTSPGSHSAYDFVVVVDAYLPFYRALAGAGHHRRSPRVLASFSRILPPNVTAFMPDRPGDPVAKCMILTGQHLERALSSAAPDHFLKGRMAHSVALVYARDRRTTTWIEDLLAVARRDVLRWAGPHLEGPFDAAGLARRMLEVSYRGEIRPEARTRVEEVFLAERGALEEIYREVLEDAARRGVVVDVGDGLYALAEEPGWPERLGNRLYFLKSKVRATLRWFKHVVTFDDWLTYIQRKVERRTGRPVELTERERKYPLLFLWPKVFRVLRTLPDRAPAPPADTPQVETPEADAPPPDAGPIDPEDAAASPSAEVSPSLSDREDGR